MRHLRRHADAFTQGGVRMNRLADIDCICTHLDGQSNLANHVASVRTDHAAAEYFAVAVRFGRIIKQQLGHAFVAAIGDGASRSRPGEQALLDLDALGLGLVFGEADPGHFGVGVGHAGDDAGVEGGGCQFLVALQFTGDDFGSHMGFVHRLVGQHRLADDVADGEDVRHIGAHLDIDVDEAPVSHGHTGFCRR